MRLGKTIVAAKLVEKLVLNNEKILILAHRFELLEQMRDKIFKATGLESVIEKAEMTSIGSDKKIVIGSIQTLMKDNRLNRFSTNEFATIIVDEAQHCVSNSFQKVLNYFHNTKILGLTATPDRGDSKSILEYFGSVAYEYFLPKAIEEGYLSRLKVQTIPLEIDLSKVHTQCGDYNDAELANAIEPFLESIADKMRIYCLNRKTIVFTPLISTSKKFRDILNERGFSAVEVNGESKDRAQILKDFEEGRYNAIVNASLLTEGYDCPSIDTVVVLRPTKIRSLYVQSLGRGTRLYPGKDHLLILDFLWHTGRHTLCCPASLIAKNEKEAEAFRSKIRGCINPRDLSEIGDEIEEEAKRNAELERNASLIRRLAKAGEIRAKIFNPIDYEILIGAGDYTPEFEWEYEFPTDGQVRVLKKNGFLIDSTITKGRASHVIENLTKRTAMGLSSPNQIRLLLKHGFIGCHTWDFAKASEVVRYLNINNWSLPEGFDMDAFETKGVLGCLK